MPRKKNIFVLMGGKSSEHDISVLSGKEVVKNLDHKKYNVFPILINKNGTEWLLTNIGSLNKLPNPFQKNSDSKEIQLSGKSVNIRSIYKPSDIVLIALHGTYGEDGTIQGMLDLLGIKYTGSGVLPSALGMDKLMFKRILAQERIPVPKFLALRKNEKLSNIAKTLGKLPYFVKPHNQGSSVGTSIVRNQRDLNKSLRLAWKYSEYAIIEEFIKGKEVTCALLGNDKPIPLSLVEIQPIKSEYFDYTSKYSEGGSREIIPANISPSLTRKIQNIAVRVHTILGCRGFSRVDFLLKNNNDPKVLEINTIPGLTPMSLLPKAALSCGINYTRLLDKIIASVD